MRTEIVKKKTKIPSLIDITEPLLDGGEIIEEIPVKKGELKKPLSIVERETRRLDKVIDKTEKLLERAEKRSSKNNNRDITKSLNSNNNIKSKSSQSHNTTRHTEPSYLDYQMLNRFPKKVMKFIFEQHKEQEVECNGLFVIDTEEAKEKLNKSPNQIANTIMRLKERGYITVERSNNCGTRAIRINKSLFEK